MIVLAFRRTTGPGLFSRLVRLFAGAPVHVALVTTQGEGWEAQHPHGVQRVTLWGSDWEYVGVECDALAALRFCARRDGAKYDTLGALLFFTPLTSRRRWTCSELAAEALAEAGADLSVLDAGRTPRALRAWARAQAARTTS